MESLVWGVGSHSMQWEHQTVTKGKQKAGPQGSGRGMDSSKMPSLKIQQASVPRIWWPCLPNPELGLRLGKEFKGLALTHALWGV